MDNALNARLERVETDLRKQLWGGIAAVAFLLTAMFTFYTRLDSKIEAVNQNLNAKIEAVNQNLNSKVDGINQNLDSKIDAINQNLINILSLMAKKAKD